MKLLGYPDLTIDMIKAAYFAMFPATVADLREAEGLGFEAYAKACSRHREEISDVLMLPVPSWQRDLDDNIVMAATEWAFLKPGASENMIAETQGRVTMEIMSNDPVDMEFIEWYVTKYKPEGVLSKLNATLGACTPKLCKLLADAPYYSPLSLYLSIAPFIPVGDVPDVPLSFMDNFPEMLDDEDYNTAFMKAYIISCLELFFDSDKVHKAVSQFPDDKLRLYFPRIVWELSEHRFYDAEQAIFDNLTDW